MVPWDDATKRAFVAQQFSAQDHHYRTNYTDTSYDVILADGEAAGRLYVARWPDEIRIVDITLLPAFRGRGLGSALLRALIEEADAAAKPLTIHVEQANPARALYERLGFRPAGEHGVYVLMRRAPG
jgi:ribosomal protein S18 acetylase RimI-like enzyme